MSKPFRLSNDQIFDRTRDDTNVLDALDDLIRAIHVHGEDKVTCDTLKGVIANSLTVWAHHEVDEEGLDG